MTDTRGWCHACGRPRDIGAMLRVRPRDPAAPTFMVCRPDLGTGCLIAAGRRDQTAIEFADQAAARAWTRDRAITQGTPRP